MTDLSLYEEVILKHSKNPQNFGHLVNPTIEIVEENPVCGDKIALQVEITNNFITDIKFTGKGCAISLSSASLMSEKIKGSTISEVEQNIKTFKAMLIANNDTEFDNLGELRALGTLKKFPVRIKCALLAWIALERCIENFSS